MRHLRFVGILLLLGVTSASAHTAEAEATRLCVAVARLDVPRFTPAIKDPATQITIHWNVDPLHVEPFATGDCRGAPPELARPLSLHLSRCEDGDKTCIEILNVPLRGATGAMQIPSPGAGEYEFRLQTDPGFHLKRLQLKESDEVHLNWTARAISGRVRVGSIGLMAAVGFGRNAVAISDETGHFRIATEELPKETRIIVAPCDAGGVVFLDLDAPVSWDRELDLEIHPAVEVYVEAPENVTPLVTEWDELPDGDRRNTPIEAVEGRWIFHPQKLRSDSRKRVCATAPNHERDCKDVLATTREVRLTLLPMQGPSISGFNPGTSVILNERFHRVEDSGDLRLSSAPSAIDVFTVMDGDRSVWIFRGSDLQEIASGSYRIHHPPARVVTVLGHSEIRLAGVGVLLDGVVVPATFVGMRQPAQVQYDSRLDLTVRARREARPFWMLHGEPEARWPYALNNGEPLRFAVELAPNHYAVEPIP